MERNIHWFNEEDETQKRKKRNAVIALVSALVGALALITALVWFLHAQTAGPAADASALANSPTAFLTTAPPQDPSALPASEAETETGLLVTFLDVGQGDCVFLQSPSGKTLLVDGGPESASQTVLDFLDKKGVVGLDAVIASHLHADHIGGLISVIDVYPVGTFYDPPFDAESETYYQLLDALKENNVTIRSPIASANSFIEWDDDVQIRILSPYGIDYGRVDDFNDTSYILRVTYGSTSLLLAGDATQVAEKLALKALPNSYFKADVLKVGHHGSSDSTGKKFLDAVNPSIAIISCGLNNEYGHPDQALLDRLNKQNITIYRTDQNGTITLLLDGTNVKVIK
ncbi:MAG TPA: MBL fold metallo-hydrolase [Candidatus Cryosericum sp.]|nr:MBL fold metallo-hydrolase [Candidatus Cryosericum sp.]